MTTKKKSFLIKVSTALLTICAIWVVFNVFNYSQTEKGADKDFDLEFKNKYSIYALNIPTNLSFAGEKVPVENFDVLESLDREFLVNTYWQSQTLLFLKRANRYFPIIEPILEKNGIPDDFKYLAIAESGLTNVVSPAGATGVWQIMKTTGKEYDLEINSEVDERYHIEKATEAACKYLNDSYKRFNNWTLVAASYNMGMGGVSKQLTRQKVDSYYDLLLNAETARYVFRIIAIKSVMKDPDKYGFVIRQKDLYTEVPTYEVIVDSTIPDFAENMTSVRLLPKASISILTPRR